MLKAAAARLLSGVAISPSNLAASARAACSGLPLLGGWEAWVRPSHSSSPPTYLASYCTQASSTPPAPPPLPPPSSASTLPGTQSPSQGHDHSGPAATSDRSTTDGDAVQVSESGSAASPPSHPEVPRTPPAGPGAEMASAGDPQGPDAGAAAAAAAARTGPASRRDKSASADVIYPSSRDDNLGVQRNWFNALFTQLSVMQRTGMAPHLRGRQKEVFEAVEREFEGLWERHVRGKGLEGTAHRGMLMCCLAIATHKVLLYEAGDDALVREVIRTNLGGTAVGIMMRLHKLRLWLLLRLLAEDPYKQAVRFLPSMQGDLGSLVSGRVVEGASEATWTASGCAFYSVLAEEGATELLPEFCCQFSMQWLEVFAEYGVRVGLEESLGFGDERCVVRISKPGAQRADVPVSADGGGGVGGGGGSSS